MADAVMPGVYATGKDALEAMPGAAVVVPVAGGHKPFATTTDYNTWRNQKKDGGRVTGEKGTKRLDRPRRKR